MVAEPPTRKRGRPKSTKSVEQQKEDKRLRHREEQRRSYKKLIMKERNKKKLGEKQKKEVARLKKFLGSKAMSFLQQQVEREEHPTLKTTKA